MPPAVPAGVPATLLERRPDVVQAEQLLVAANADVGAAKALFYPTISLTGTLGSHQRIASSTSLRPDALIWSMGAGLLQPIYQRRTESSGTTTRPRRDYDQAIAQYQKAALNAYREVADSLVTIQKLASSAAPSCEPGVEALRDATQLARSRYENGLSTYMEVIARGPAALPARSCNSRGSDGSSNARRSRSCTGRSAADGSRKIRTRYTEVIGAMPAPTTVRS